VETVEPRSWKERHAIVVNLTDIGISSKLVGEDTIMKIKVRCDQIVDLEMVIGNDIKIIEMHMIVSARKWKGIVVSLMRAMGATGYITDQGGGGA
jgi:hypothetical protein